MNALSGPKLVGKNNRSEPHVSHEDVGVDLEVNLGGLRSKMN